MTEENRKIQIPIVATDETKTGLDSVKRGVNDMADSVAKAGDKASKGIGGIGAGAPAASQKLDSATRSMIGSIQRTTAAMEAGSKTGTKYFEALAAQRGVSVDALRPYLAQLEAVNRAQGSATVSLQNFSRVAGIGFGAASISIAAIATGALGLSKTLFDASVSAERLRIGLDFASGGNGRRELAYITDLSNELGLSLESTARAYTGFSAAARATSLEGAGARAVFEAVSKASAVMGLSAEQSTGALLALQQMVSKGTVQAEELRGQLGERLPGAFQIAARAMGTTTQELGKMLQAGEVLASDFLPKFAAQLEKELGGGAEKAADRLGAATNRMETAIFRLKAALGDAGIAQGYGGFLSGVAAAANKVASDIEKLTRQGPLRQAAAELKDLDDRRKVLQNGLALGFYPPSFKKELDEVNAKLALAKERFRALDSQEKNLTAPPDPRSNFPSRGSRAAFESRDAEEAAKAAEQLVAIRNRVNKVDTQYLKTLSELEALRKTGRVSEQEYIGLVTKLANETHKRSAGSKAMAKSESEAAKAAREAAEQYASLSLRVSERIAAADQELKLGRQLTEAEKEEAKILELLASSKNKMNAAVAAGLLVKVQEAKAKEALIKVQRTELEQAKELAKALQAQAAYHTGLLGADIDSGAAEAGKQAAEAEQALSTLRERTRALEEENKAAELAASGNISLAVAIEQVTIARLEEERAGTTNVDRSAHLDREIARRKELLTLMSSRDTREAASKAAKGAENEWKRAAESIQDNLTDALLRGFESGKGFAENLRDTVVNMFKTLVLRPVIQAVLAPVAGGLAGLMPGSASAGGFGGGLGSATSALSLFGSAGSSFGMGLNAGFSALVGESGLFGALSAGATSIGAGSVAAGLGTIAGALGPIALGAMALRSIFGGRGETRSGGQYAGTTYLEGPSGGEINGQATRQAIQTTQDTINETLRRLGATTRIDQLFSGLESSKNGKGFAYAGAQLSDGSFVGQDQQAGRNNRRGSMTPEEAAAAFGEELKQVTLQALQASDVPGELSNYLRSLGDIDKLTGGALDAAYERVNKAITERAALEDRLFDMTASEADKLTRARDREWAAIDETNRALLAQVYVQEDLRRYAEEAERIATERSGLEDRLLDLVGSEADKLARTRQREREAIDATNQALLEQIYRQEDLRTAAQLAADQAAQMQDAERSLQERLYGIFEGAITSVSEEIRRLTGQRTESRDLSTLQAQFAITTAQARALDPKALERLPSLSQAIEQATLGTARSRDEVDRQQAQLAQSLSQTLTLVSNQIGQPAGTDDIVAELKAARELAERGVEENQVHTQALVKILNKFTTIVGRWDIDGMPAVREIA